MSRLIIPRYPLGLPKPPPKPSNTFFHLKPDGSHYQTGRYNPEGFRMAWEQPAPEGTLVYPIFGGVASYVGSYGDLGSNVVAITDGWGRQWWYGHMRSTTAKQGHTIELDKPFGEVGEEGFATGPHLYVRGYEVPLNGRPWNSEPIFNPWPWIIQSWFYQYGS